MNLHELRDFVSRNQSVLEQHMDLEAKARLITALKRLTENPSELSFFPESTIIAMLKYFAVLLSQDLIHLLEETQE